ncbi:MAG: Clp protease N-terminal domain-containing protein [Cyanobacteriota bacterium]
MQPTNPNQFTATAWEAIARTSDIAKASQHQTLESEHLMKALLEQSGLTISLLNILEASVQRMCDYTETFIQRQAKISGSNSTAYLGRSLNYLLDRAESHRQQFQDDYISVEHLILAFAKDSRFGKALFHEFRLSEVKIKSAIVQIRAEQTATNQNSAGKSKILEKYGRDLTQSAFAGKLDPLIGRDNEIRRLIQVLSRRTKSNLVLIGEPGVGKTAIVQGLAQRIICGDVPPSLKNRQVIALDRGTLIATATSPDEFEEYLKSVLKEIRDSQFQIILFIDELHTVFGVSATQGATSAGNLLEAMLEQGELRCIGATTVEEYRKFSLENATLARRFQQVYVEQPCVEDTISILRGLKERYEVFHGVKIADSALVAATTLSVRHISDRFLPDKAIDLVDEAAARLKIKITSKPEQLDKIDRQILQLEMEKFSLQAESESREVNRLHRTSVERLQQLDQELTYLIEEQRKLNTQWQLEKSLIERIERTREEIVRVNVEIEQAMREDDLNRSAELRYGKLAELQKVLQTAEYQLATAQSKGNSLLRQEVTEVDIAQIISEGKGISISEVI